MNFNEKAVAAGQARLAKTIRQLQEKAKIRDSLKTPPVRGALNSKRKLVSPVGASSGIASPLTEKQQTRQFHVTVQELYSSDGLFSLQYYNTRAVTMLDANGREVVFIYDDYQPA